MYEYESAFEFNPEMSNFENEQFEYGQSEWGEVFNEGELLDLTSELLEITNEAELDHFINGLINSVGKAIGDTVTSPVGQAVGGVLKGIAKKALPIAGSALAGYFGGPLGAQIGSGLAAAASDALGLEAGELSLQDHEFEGGKQFVRLAADTVKNAVSVPANINPRDAAKKAAISAVQTFAPKLLDSPLGSKERPAKTEHGLSQNGHWRRHGRNIIIVNC